MTLVELKELLETTGFPVAYSHFIATKGNPLPLPPYICYLVPYSSNFFADDQVYQEIDNVQIELYTSKKDLAAEAKLKTALNNNNIPYECSEGYIENGKLYQKIYEVRLI
jgi:hypothetical protein